MYIILNWFEIYEHVEQMLSMFLFVFFSCFALESKWISNVTDACNSTFKQDKNTGTIVPNGREKGNDTESISVTFSVAVFFNNILSRSVE